MAFSCRMDGPRIPCLNIALVCEQRSSYLKVGYSEEQCAALTHIGEIDAVMTTLERLGHHVTLVPGIQSLVQLLAAGKDKGWDLVFNMAQGFHGSARESQVPALLEAYRVPYTFSDAATMAICQNKPITKTILGRHMIPNAPFGVIPMLNDDVADFSERSAALPPYPLFIKPVIEGSSKGIDGFNKVKEPAELEPAVRELARKFPDQDILVERFLSGREFTVSILGTGSRSRVIGIREHIWQASPDHRNKNGYQSNGSLDFASRESKSSKRSKKLLYDDSHDMDEPHIKATCEVALRTWKVLNCRDAGRVDIRFDSDEPGSVPNVLEVSISIILIISDAMYSCLHGGVGESHFWPSSRSFPVTSDGDDEWHVLQGTFI
ncbi:unnamed protein product [Penicillium nalgiovense]|uniref:ATP-grasp domain-containing protein n=1 Tax=Penicillium nalgiovense TaxID=60175 RepID=A0A9W4IHA8_PENNA|nr:unnamed protein product [Penicillium nalgiovense]CAG8173826.1 unnamed protein product [Penicillium nalgiovense]CAG8185067.1 unnamed protein product [Penicillium nalgiovense]CAG8186674.1 unnamed protein product [Penicillium nalgiovense]CAG8256369.1 unnamed protein product [Penicillium nalgiovense]